MTTPATTITPRRPGGSARRPRREKWEVLIVGAGPAGLSTWLHLHALAPQVAARTLVIDRARFPRDKPCGGAITPLGQAILAGLDASVAVPTAIATAIEFRLDRRSHVFRHPEALRVVRRVEFDAALVRLATARGMTLRQGEAFRSLAPGRGGVAVETARDTYTARVVVAADGAQSAVRRAVQPDGRPRLARLLEVVTPIAPTELDVGRGDAVFDFTALAAGLPGYVWHFPCVVGGAPAATRGVFDSRVRAGGRRPDLRQILQAALAERAVDWSAAHVAAHPIRLFDPAAPPSAPHVLFVGDAAGSDAALGEGIAHALDFGDLAANAIADAFDAGDFSFADYAARLRAHPVGQTLHHRRRLADDLYGSGAGSSVKSLELLAGSLLPS